MIVMVEYSKIFCSVVSSCHQPKQGVSAILRAAGENSILDLFFFSLCPLEIVLLSVSKLL